MISHVDDPNEVEVYLSEGGSDTVILSEVEKLLNYGAEFTGIKPVPPLTPSSALPYLKALWDEAGTNPDNRLMRAVKRGLVYMIFYLRSREGESRAHPDTLSKGLWPATVRGDIAMVDALLRAGAKVKDAGVPEQALIDLLLKGGLLEKVSPEGKHYHRECDWPTYELTGRPMTYMTSMCKRVVSKLPKTELVATTTHLYLPVLRYQKLYYQTHEPVKHCGTFYYIDPSSSVLLDLGKTAIFGSKVHALFVLSAGIRELMRPGTAWWNMIVREMKATPDLYTNLQAEQVLGYRQ